MSKKKLFDFVIGNPPYQETRESTKDMPVYNEFMDAAYGVSKKVELITPARFLFNAGATPKEWNKKMLNDEHFKVLSFEIDSSKIFPNTDIKGGLAVSYRDDSKNFGAIRNFSSKPELNSIQRKVEGNPSFSSISSIVYSPAAFKFNEKMHSDFPNVRYKEVDGKNVGILSKGNDYMIATNVFEKMPNILLDKKPVNGEYVGIVGLVKGKRKIRYIKREYITDSGNLDKYKVIIPESNGSGAIGEVLSTPLIGDPLIGHSQSFISIGSLNTQSESESLFKYVKTKFARTLLGILKITQHNQRPVWQFVPLQDFTASSDIDWTMSIHEIDLQLYKKYGLDEHEIDFIEKNVKEMN